MLLCICITYMLVVVTSAEDGNPCNTTDALQCLTCSGTSREDCIDNSYFEICSDSEPDSYTCYEKKTVTSRGDIEEIEYGCKEKTECCGGMWSQHGECSKSGMCEDSVYTCEKCMYGCANQTYRCCTFDESETTDIRPLCRELTSTKSWYCTQGAVGDTSVGFAKDDQELYLSNGTINKIFIAWDEEESTLNEVGFWYNNVWSNHGGAIVESPYGYCTFGEDEYITTVIIRLSGFGGTICYFEARTNQSNVCGPWGPASCSSNTAFQLEGSKLLWIASYVGAKVNALEFFFEADCTRI